MVIKTIISKTTKVFKGLCTPARIEFILTIIGAIATIITCFASFSETKYQSVCNNILPSTIVSGIFIWILNALCKGGAGIISWILVVGPLFIMLFSIFFGKSKEEFGFLGGSSKVASALKKARAANIAAKVAAIKAAAAKASAEKAELAAKREKEGEKKTKPIKKSKELIELEKKLAKLNSKIAKQTKKCINKCTSKKLKKLKEQIKDEISNTKAENPDFS